MRYMRYEVHEVQRVLGPWLNSNGADGVAAEIVWKLCGCKIFIKNFPNWFHPLRRLSVVDWNVVSFTNVISNNCRVIRFHFLIGFNIIKRFGMKSLKSSIVAFYFSQFWSAVILPTFYPVPKLPSALKRWLRYSKIVFLPRHRKRLWWCIRALKIMILGGGLMWWYFFQFWSNRHDSKNKNVL